MVNVRVIFWVRFRRVKIEREGGRSVYSVGWYFEGKFIRFNIINIYRIIIIFSYKFSIIYRKF